MAPVMARLLKSLTKACLKARASESAARTDRSTLSIMRSVAENTVTTMSHLMMLCSFLNRLEAEWPVTLPYTGMPARGSRRSHTLVRNTGMNERKEETPTCSVRTIATGREKDIDAKASKEILEEDTKTHCEGKQTCCGIMHVSWWSEVGLEVLGGLHNLTAANQFVPRRLDHSSEAAPETAFDKPSRNFLKQSENYT